ncbi:YALI0F14971p [Yarrowia lipolytica CLIB122]|uniref:YALI0F14971p n=2 Tax=Yarrowia lipolytica TaxID=4952 RepID=Q6C1M5_YARLI|nr:YALI0F14971p [Yarrowia lipolytica CLIB122]AOW07200.1 hypothetical protein YALI1_F20010g [Yarrowia lipolytica]KAB8281719.1 hypothetical protein BKA91DRAFT_163287 [Yarrowia lipolytica]KAE8171940.1 hypothetical protein BKA90DRAFT_157613 [Yarrowia lipolytica]RMJ00486.1 hypothetical protein BD777DRAFT_140076 [Yarrowia lipolytica]CAG78246.1 YALI0F14971p [Yarrowia lipolytica CLIB122]|eukprot:XP_505437.1 YALI0F14971p [Yarrowia lipolytica CLIB122]
MFGWSRDMISYFSTENPREVILAFLVATALFELFQLDFPPLEGRGIYYCSTQHSSSYSRVVSVLCQTKFGPTSYVYRVVLFSLKGDTRKSLQSAGCTLFPHVKVGGALTV